MGSVCGKKMKEAARVDINPFGIPTENKNSLYKLIGIIVTALAPPL